MVIKNGLFPLFFREKHAILFTKCLQKLPMPPLLHKFASENQTEKIFLPKAIDFLNSFHIHWGFPLVVVTGGKFFVGNHRLCA